MVFKMIIYDLAIQFPPTVVKKHISWDLLRNGDLSFTFQGGLCNGHFRPAVRFSSTVVSILPCAHPHNPCQPRWLGWGWWWWWWWRWALSTMMVICFRTWAWDHHDLDNPTTTTIMIIFKSATCWAWPALRVAAIAQTTTTCLVAWRFSFSVFFS